MTISPKRCQSMTKNVTIEKLPASAGVKDRGMFAAIAVIALLAILQVVYASIAELRTDEAYYWTWSKENVLSFLDHPPMIAWFVRFGTAIFGDTNFGVRFAGLLAMWIAQALIADIVWRQTRDRFIVVLAILMPQAALEYGLFGSRVLPDAAMIPFAVAMVWALVRLTETSDAKWWLAAGVFGGLALLSKYTVVLLVPAIVAFALVPDRRTRWLRSPYPYLAALIALLIFSPVMYWNWQHDWDSFRFQFVRARADHGMSMRTVVDYIGLQAVLVGPLLFPVALCGTIMLGWRGYRQRNPVFVLLSTCALVPFFFFLWRSLSLRVGDTWPMLVWPFAFAATAINLAGISKVAENNWFLRTAQRWAVAAIAFGVVLNLGAFYLYGISNFTAAGARDPIGKEAGYREIALGAKAATGKSGATWIGTINYRIYAMLRWHLKDSIPVIQMTERSRFNGFDEKRNAAAVGSGAGLFVDTFPNDGNVIERATPAAFEVVGQQDRIWRGITVDKFVFKKITNWIPDLSPKPGTVFYDWPPLG